MRSFRRNPKRNDNDDYHPTLDQKRSFEALPHINTTSHASSNTPISSPIMYSNTQFTPPQSHNNSQHVSSPSSSTNLSSPKKLLTPIRNLFHSSSNSKSNGNIAATNENLHNVLFNSPATTFSASTAVVNTPTSRQSKGLRGHKKGNNSIGSLQPLDLEPAPKPSFTHSQSQLSLHEYNKKGFSHSIGVIYSPSTTSSSTGMKLNDNNNETAFLHQSKLLPPPMKPYISTKKPMNPVATASQSSLVSQSASFHSSASASISSPITYTQPSSETSNTQTHLNTNYPNTPSSLKPPIHLSTKGANHSDDDNLEESQSRERSFNDSDISLAPSESHFQTSTTRKVSFKKKPEIFKSNSTESVDSISESESNSDSSSQFSFVKDMRGGRNTSVKYYKNTRPQPNQKLVPTFNQNDLNYEVDDYSDYDFENNGMDEDYGDDEDDDEEVGYNNAFDDDDEDEYSSYNKSYNDIEDQSKTQNNIEAPPKSELLPIGHDHDQLLDVGFELYKKGSERESNKSKVFELDDFDMEFNQNESNKDYLSLQRSLPTVQIENLSLDPSSSNKDQFNNSFHFHTGSHESFPASDDNANDILESYLDTSNSPYGSKNGSGFNSNNSSRSPEEKVQDGKFPDDVTKPEIEPESDNNLKLFEINSPLINGVTIGNNLRHRSGRSENYEGDPKRSRSLRDDQSGSPQNSFIHREVNKYVDGNGLSEKEIYQNRVYKSFHGSISDEFGSTFDNNILNKKDLDNISKTEVKEDLDTKPESRDLHDQLGLGILTRAEPNENDVPINSERKEKVRKSVNDMMDILQQFGDPEENLTTINKTSKGDSQQTKRDSILNLMSILEKVEEEAPSKTKEKQRNSILGVMNLLESLEEGLSQERAQTISTISKQIENAGKGEDRNNGDRKEMSKKDKFNNPNRKSINDMMATLASFNIESDDFSSMEKRQRNRISQLGETSNAAKIDSSIRKVPNVSEPNQIPKGKRYSWFGDDETNNFSNLATTKIGTNSSGLRNELTEDIKGIDDLRNFVFDESVIDEINQLPEDFDFEEYSNQHNSDKPDQKSSSFYRSNSYNKKPVRAGVENTFQTNKIETLNKTVTIYRSASPSNSDANRSRSISRAASARSSTSFISINEGETDTAEDCDQREITAVDRMKEYTQKKLFFDDDLKSPTKKFIFENKSCDSIPRNSFALGTITEAESPSLK
ncbi:hypothetical protein CLIB1423_05S06018 [[Candida] railenensis]|uniref:Uncharacterized protein n=1 Tax=[Candida] railenensis TaxID=45579 RepID=A0A9P0VX60_9ASCO|nr:hypothetical protein CLIB1423_05S06018 [[Candida] railenensis]